MRKSIFALIIAVVFTAGMLIGTTTLANADSTNTDKQTLKKLQAASKLLANVDKRLDRVLQGMGDPDTAPLDPSILNALLKIRDTATTIVTRVDQKLPEPIPTPPPDLPP